MASMDHADPQKRSAPEPRPWLANRRATYVSNALSATQFPLQLANAAVGAYLTGLTAIAWRAHRSGRQAHLPSMPTTRFAVLVPAHDESELIAETVANLRSLDYPTDLFTVHVVADNCSDATAVLATEAGAVAHERFGDPGKGPALEWLIGRVLDDSPCIDAFVIVDADSALNASFLRVMDARVQAGDRVIQAYYGVKEPEASVPVAIRYAALAARHYLRPAARDLLRGSVGLFGNGMVFATDVLRGRSLTGHLTEDIELHLNLVLSGERVAFAGDAHVIAEMPVGLGAAHSQNERWERGRIEMTKRYTRQLLTPGRGTAMGERVRRADVAADLLIPPTSILALGATAALGGSVAGRLLGRSRLSTLNLALAAASAAGLGAYVLSALRMVGAPRSVYRALLHAPGSVLWKARLWAGVLRPASEVEWQRTTRNAETVNDSRAQPCAI